MHAYFMLLHRFKYWYNIYVCMHIYICMHIYVGPYAYAHVCAVGLGTCKLKIVELFVELPSINIHQSV